jgi:hypothetical protein
MEPLYPQSPWGLVFARRGDMQQRAFNRLRNSIVTLILPIESIELSAHNVTMEFEVAKSTPPCAVDVSGMFDMNEIAKAFATARRFHADIILQQGATYVRCVAGPNGKITFGPF